MNVWHGLICYCQPFTIIYRWVRNWMWDASCWLRKRVKNKMLRWFFAFVFVFVLGGSQPLFWWIWITLFTLTWLSHVLIGLHLCSPAIYFFLLCLFLIHADSQAAMQPVWYDCIECFKYSCIGDSYRGRFLPMSETSNYYSSTSGHLCDLDHCTLQTSLTLHTFVRRFYSCHYWSPVNTTSSISKWFISCVKSPICWNAI